MSTPTPDPNLSTSHTSGAAAADNQESETLTPLEQEVLDEYARLLDNLNNMSTLLSTLSTKPSAEILDALRGLERKTSLVFTLLKASVYSIVLNQQIQDGGSEGDDAGGGGAVGMEGMGMGMGLEGMGMGMGGTGDQGLGGSRGSVL